MDWPIKIERDAKKLLYVMGICTKALHIGLDACPQGH